MSTKKLQIIGSIGGNGNIDIDLGGANEGEANPINADTLNGKFESELSVANADTLGGNSSSYYAKATKLTPRNLLDNSDFTNPVNQRGLNSYTSVGYNIDRWKSNASGTITVKENCINFASTSGASTYFIQYIENGVIKPGKRYTLAICLLDGTKGVISDVLNTNMNAISKNIKDKSDNQFTLRLGYSENLFFAQILTSTVGGHDIEWAALYEGEYNIDTLPEYQPKGYAAELLECQRYFYSTVGAYFYCGYGSATSATEFFATMLLPVPMRVNPTVSGQFIARGGGKEHQLTFVSVAQRAANGLSMAFTGSNLVTNEAYILRAGSTIQLSADL